MVQTRSKRLLLKNTPTEIVTEETSQRPLPTIDKKKRTRKKKIADNSPPPPDLPQAQAPTPPRDLPPRQAQSTSPAATSTFLLKTAAQESDSSEENDLCTPFLVPFNRTHNSNLFDEDNAFDNDLYEEQKGLIDAYNREDNAEDDSQLNDINNDEITVK